MRATIVCKKQLEYALESINCLKQEVSEALRTVLCIF